MRRYVKPPLANVNDFPSFLLKGVQDRRSTLEDLGRDSGGLRCSFYSFEPVFGRAQPYAAAYFNVEGVKTSVAVPPFLRRPRKLATSMRSHRH